jgi:hypothetical protein
MKDLLDQMEGAYCEKECAEIAFKAAQQLRIERHDL